jgi:ComF family protein
LKYDHRPEISEPLGQWLAQGWLAQSQSPHLRVIAVPIPLHGDREQQRGYNQAELIARSFCQITGIPLKAKGLLRTQATTAQHSLSRQARFQNLSSVFSLGPDLQNSTKQRQIILIDDIFTTGATLKAATDLLHKVKFQVAGLLSVAITERQQPPQYCSDKTQTQCTRPLNLRHFPQVGASAHGSGFPILEDFAPQPPPELGGRGAECVVHH